MATILRGRISLQLKISASYIAILLIVLVLMNTYPLLVSQDLVFRAKRTTLLGSASALNAAVAGLEELTEDSTFADLTITSYTGEVLDMEKALVVYQYLASEADITLTAETPVTELLAICGLYKDGAFQAGSNRVSFAGFHGGRSYGEQIDAIVDHILTHDMTLEDVYEMFRTVNQQSQPIQERDAVSGATIAFVGDFQRMTYLAIHGELFEGVASTTPVEEGTRYEVVTQGYGGEMETYVTIDGEGRITAISVRDHQETAELGGKLVEADSDFIQALIAGQDNVEGVDAVAGATVTSEAMKKAVRLAQEAGKA